jgi:hypothetical protein
LLSKVVKTEDQKADVEKARKDLLEKVKEAQPDVNFSFDQFPLAKEDVELLRKDTSMISCLRFPFMREEPRCLLIPESVPNPIRLGQPFKVELHVAFNRIQPTDGQFALVVAILGEDGMHGHTVKLPPVEIKHGRTKVTYSEDFAGLPKKQFKLATDPMGKAYLFVYLAFCAKKGPGKILPSDWQALSTACRWPIAE